MCSSLPATASRVAESRLLKDLALPPDWQQWAIFRLKDEIASQALRNIFESAGQFRFSIHSDETPFVVADLRHGETPDLSTVCDWRRVCVIPQWHADCPVLFASLPPEAKKPRIIMPRPSREERLFRPYSIDSLLGLRASITALNPKSLVSLKTPSKCIVLKWDWLQSLLNKAELFLRNAHKRYKLPACILVTEFDPVFVDGRDNYGPGFHLLFAEPLPPELIERLKRWWLEMWDAEDNRGGYFHYSSDGGGIDLNEYGAKQRSYKKENGNIPHFVKFRPDWMPERINQSLWFCIGCDRKTAAEGAKIPVTSGIPLRNTECASIRKIIAKDLQSAKLERQRRRNSVTALTDGYY